MGRVVEDVEQVREPKPGKNLTLSIDRRIQFLAYNELKNALAEFDAASGSMVILDVPTGEVLAMVNLPTYNPNALAGSKFSDRRNRAVTDLIEPGSTIKPILMAAALSSGKYTPTSPLIDTTGGHWFFQGHDIHDTHNYGVLTPTGVITKSSNVGAARIARRSTRRTCTTPIARSASATAPTAASLASPRACCASVATGDRWSRRSWATATAST
jgi:cell division protein FtsI (penicillin-binding protein 3)